MISMSTEYENKTKVQRHKKVGKKNQLLKNA